MWQVLNWVASLASLVCFILVVVKMFQKNQTTLGIVSLVLVLCCGIGGLIAFVYGWIKSGEWQIMPIMLVWTGAIIVGILAGIMDPTTTEMIQKQMQFGK
jgi:hypothetical protein